MLVEIIDSDKGYSYVVSIKEKFKDIFTDKIPFRINFNVWKEEVYFETPINIINQEDKIYKVKRGYLYYWPPGKALCLFYGISDIYTPGILVGELIGPTNYLAIVENGDRGIVQEHVIDNDLKELVHELSRLGYIVGTPLYDNSRTLTALKRINNLRLAFTLFIEDYGLHLETESFYKHDHSYQSMAIAYKIKTMLSNSKYIRYDINEHGYTALTGIMENTYELLEVLKELEIWFPKIKQALFK